MTITNIGTRKIGADDISFGRASLVYQDYLGVTRSIAQVNATHLPFYSVNATLENLIDGSYNVPLKVESIATSSSPWIDAISFNNGALSHTTLIAANTTLAGTSCVLRISKGAWSISDDVTIDPSIVVRIDAGVMLTIANGKTLAFGGPVWADPVQIFTLSGTGQVTFESTTPEIYADWFVNIADPDHTNQIMAAIDSTSHLVSAGIGRRPPVIFTRDLYKVSGLPLINTASKSYVGASLIGRPTGGTNESVKLLVSNAAANGIKIKADTAALTWVNYITLENLSIVKAAYPGDNNGDYGIYIEGVQWLNLRNVKVRNFGGAGLFITESYMNEYVGFSAFDCYRGIWSRVSSWGANWGCTTQNFTNTMMYDCKIHIEIDGGRSHMTFTGYTSDVNHFTTQAVIKTTSTGSTHDVQIYFSQAWLEGMSAPLIDLDGTTLYPFYNQIVLRDSILANNTRATVVTAASTASAVITLESCVFSDSSESGRVVVIPNRSDGFASTMLNGIDSGGNANVPMGLYGSTDTASAYLTYGPSSMAFVSYGVGNYRGVVHHRLVDESFGPESGKAADLFRSTVRGLWTPTLVLQQSGNGYGIVRRVSNSTIKPVASWCDTSLATAYKLTNVAWPGQFAVGDEIIITGAGGGGGNLTTVITNIEWDGSIFYIQDAVQATLLATALNLNSIRGDIKLDTSPTSGGYIGWVCTTAGAPGTWKTWGAIS